MGNSWSHLSSWWSVTVKNCPWYSPLDHCHQKNTVSFFLLCCIDSTIQKGGFKSCLSVKKFNQYLYGRKLTLFSDQHNLCPVSMEGIFLHLQLECNMELFSWQCVFVTLDTSKQQYMQIQIASNIYLQQLRITWDRDEIWPLLRSIPALFSASYKHFQIGL